jgi:hypothetical protein
MQSKKVNAASMQGIRPIDRSSAEIRFILVPIRKQADLLIIIAPLWLAQY